MRKLVLVITVDTNDGDFLTNISEITPEVLERLRPVFVAIKDQSGHNYPIGECADEGELEAIYDGILDVNQRELFEQYVPYHEFGFHTIEDIKVLYVEKEEVFL